MPQQEANLNLFHLIPYPLSDGLLRASKSSTKPERKDNE